MNTQSPDARLERVETRVAGSRATVALERRPIDTRLESRVNLAAGLGRENDPRFGLAKIGRIELRPLLIVRMHLHGKRLLTIEKLEQQRKLGCGW